jgi:hypothetical protein
MLYTLLSKAVTGSNMKSKEKLTARKLRAEGYSINEISRKVGAAKSSVSGWVKNIKLTNQQKKQLSEKGIRKAIIEQRRATRLKNESAKRQLIIDAAKKQINKLSKKELWLIGSILYWAEGGKTKRGLVRFSNSDAEMIKFMMAFFRSICKVPEGKFRGYIHIHPHLDHQKAERYWSTVTGIPQKRFYKTYRKTNKSSKHERDSLPFGTFDIYICNTELFLKICGWVRGIFKACNKLAK